LPACLSFVLTFAPGAFGQTDADSATSSIGLRVGYCWPLGGWRMSPVASSVELISGSFAFEGDLDFRIGNRWTLGVEGGYSALNGSAWEEYASGKGDRVSISGSFVHFALLLRPHIKVRRPDIIRMEIGPALLLSHGEEIFEGRTYPYDFLNGVSFGVQGGIEYIRVLNESLAATVKVSGMFFPSAVQRVGGASDSIVLLPVTVGIRFLL
jgi:hypothetical protein